jgi:murein DD-endopeptidase MepM/ murein hydrolase activator NlpD
MRQVAFWSSCGRSAGGIVAAAGLAFVVAGCSSGVSRFDFPSFNLTSNDTPSDTSSADYASTSSLPPVLPSESVYSAGGAPDPQYARSSLPPPDYTPRPAAYSPATSGRLGAQHANYGAQSAPEPQPAVIRPARVSGYRLKVAKGDTLSTLSRRYGVSVEEIMSANNLPDGRLQIGQELVMPGVKGPKVIQAEAAPEPNEAPGQAEATPAPAPEAGPAPASDQSTYKVEKGDTPHGIAAKLGVDEKALIAANNLNPNNLKIGQVLTVPDQNAAPDMAANEPGPPASSTNPAVRVVKTETILAPGSSLAEEEAQSVGQDAAAKPGPKPAEVAASSEITGEDKPKAASAGDLPTPDPMSGNSFRWPVKGRVIAQFGARPDGGHNDGIDVAVPQGTSVQAAENGVVAYAGNELKGYGNLVLIRHANNWVSAYANNEELLVKRGDKVRRGQIIAKAGATGAVSQPQVHFELRKGSRPVDPTKYMSDAAASAD